MKPNYRCIEGAFVAQNPQKRGVVEFYGGALFELLPQVSYEYLLEGIFNAGYSIIAVPYTVSLDHMRTAFGLLEQRDKLRKVLGINGSSKEHPHFWVGHSVGCKIIALLEFLTNLEDKTGIANEPSILLAPNLSDTQATVPKPLGVLLDFVKQGVSPTRTQTQSLIRSRPELYTLTHVFSFDGDQIAGNRDGTLPGGKPENSDVFWFNQELKNRKGFQTFEFKGTHIAPLGFRFGPVIVQAEPNDWIARMPNLVQLSASSRTTLEQLLDQILESLETLRESIP